jgi:hypothetical protein
MYLRTAPLEEKYCAICKKQLHGLCSAFNGDDGEITCWNHCFSCCSAPTIYVAQVANVVSTYTQQFGLLTMKDIEPKRVIWNDFVAGDRSSI